MVSVVLQRTLRFSVYSDPTTCSSEWIVVNLACTYSKRLMLDTLLRRHRFLTIIHEDCYEHLLELQLFNHPILQLSDFESIHWESVLDGRDRAASYLIRKGLSRKAQFALQCKRYCSKTSSSILTTSIPYTLIVDVWSAYEDMTFDFSNGMRCTFDQHLIRNTPLKSKLEYLLDDVSHNFTEHPDWHWILKPSVVNKGFGIQLVRNWPEFISALESTQDIREWVLQKYISNPLLINGHKFHIRTYVLCKGALEVYVYGPMLLLLAAHT